MRALLALLPAAALLALQGCGDTCSTAATEVMATGGCNGTNFGAAGVSIQVAAKPACQSCAQSSPGCNISDVSAGQVFLDVTVKECDSDKGCSAPSCAFGNVACSYTPSASGTLTINYRTGGSTASETVNIGAGSATSCTL